MESIKVSILTKNKDISIEMLKHEHIEIIEPNQYKIAGVITTLDDETIIRVTQESVLFQRQDPLSGYNINPSHEKQHV